MWKIGIDDPRIVPILIDNLKTREGVESAQNVLRRFADKLTEDQLLQLTTILEGDTELFSKNSAALVIQESQTTNKRIHRKLAKLASDGNHHAKSLRKISIESGKSSAGGTLRTLGATDDLDNLRQLTRLLDSENFLERKRVATRLVDLKINHPEYHLALIKIASDPDYDIHKIASKAVSYTHLTLPTKA